jgi:hypothetical protein
VAESGAPGFDATNRYGFMAPAATSKCYDLIAPVIGTRKARRLIDAVWDLENLTDVRKLRTLYRP